jgi:hypothetical protein
MRIFYLLIGMLLILGLWACQPSKTTPDPQPTVTISLNSQDTQDWLLEDAQEANVGTIGAKDPTLTLSVGTRYTIINKAGITHPFQLLDGTTILLSENGGGDFEDDATVNFEKKSGSISFTLSQELANVLDAYNCAYHPAMAGKITSVSAK